MVRPLSIFVFLVLACVSRAEEEINPLIRSLDPG